jgi:integration host factor subunit beta
VRTTRAFRSTSSGSCATVPIFGSITDALTEGRRFELRGFGSFVVRQRRAREGHNPKTGAPISVAAKRVRFFTVGKELKRRVKREVSPDARDTLPDAEGQ